MTQVDASTAAPLATERDVTPVDMGLKHISRVQKRSALIIEQTIIEPQITVIEENLGTIEQLALTAEREFGALVQAQLALFTEVQAIQNNIRINTFRARFSQVVSRNPISALAGRVIYSPMLTPHRTP